MGCKPNARYDTVAHLLNGYGKRCIEHFGTNGYCALPRWLYLDQVEAAV